jgi:hypothetical protein
MMRWPTLHLGRLALAFLAITLLTGVALIPLYDPDAALASVEAMEAGIAWAWLLRALHGFSAHALVVVTLAHLVELMLRRRETELGAGMWWRSVATLPLLVMAMLSGFVMRGDSDAVAALEVWRGILAEVPVLGAGLAYFMLGTTDNTMAVVALHHVGTFTVLLLMFSAEHGKRLFPDVRAGVLAGLVTLVLAGVVPLGLGAAEASADQLFTGPWYLLGLQGILLDLPRALSWLAPLGLVILLGLYRHVDGRARRALLVALLILTVAYLGWSIRMLVAQ